VLGLGIAYDVVKEILSLAEGHDRIWCPSSLLFDGYHNSFGGVKQLVNDIDISWAPNVKFRKEWNSTFTPPPHVPSWLVHGELYILQYTGTVQVLCLMI